MEANFKTCTQKDKCMDAFLEGLFKRINEVNKDVELTPEGWKMYYRLHFLLETYPNPQTQHVTGHERDFIKGIKEHHKYSMSDLAFIFRRSKSTIHEVLNR